MRSEARFFVDERGGCIAVRDRELTLEDDRGLHPTTCGVVKYWQGVLVQSRCEHCGQDKRGTWMVKPEDLTAAQHLCGELNAGSIAYTPNAEDVETYKERMSDAY